MDFMIIIIGGVTFLAVAALFIIGLMADYYFLLSKKS